MTAFSKSVYSLVPANVATLTFGRDTAQFKQLITYLALLSIGLWVVVFITTVVRMLALVVYRQRKPKVAAREMDQSHATQ